jgi:hypothetical protein
MILRISLILLIATTNCFAQYYKSYNWSGDPKLHELTTKEAEASSIGILEKHIVEYNRSLFAQELISYETIHKITRVNDDKGVNRHNTVYIPMYGVKNVLDIKARTINSNGEVVLLNEDSIKEINNVEEYGDFKIFAIEGVEKNSEIEVLYTVEKEFDMHGSETLQNEYPIREAQFLFITGDLNSRIKAYRTETPFEKIEIDGKSAKRLTLKGLPAMIEEEYATPDANKIAVVYQCFPGDQIISHEMFWNNVVNNVGGKFFPEEPSELVKKDLPKITKDLQDLNTFKIATLIDDFIKTNFTIVKNNNAELSDLNYILTNRTSSDFGILKAYAHYLKAFDIEYEIVVTADRFTYKFDPDFFAPNMLRDFLIYLPTEEKYIAPDRVHYRVAEAPFNFLGNYGLFITESFEYYFSKIVQSDPDYSRINKTTNITFYDELESVSLDQYQEYTGHWSATSRFFLNLSSEQGIKEYEDYLTTSGIEDKVVKSFETENTEMSPLEYNLPLIVKCNITSESLLEEAGDSFIFQIGKVIGTQSELYQEVDRVNPIEMTYPNQYDYDIIINIPDGYTAEGLEVLNIDKSFKSVTGEKICKFESSYKLEGNTIRITIQEFYKSNEYEVSRYDEFRSVINAASDFNKTSILLRALE